MSDVVLTLFLPGLVMLILGVVAGALLMRWHLRQSMAEWQTVQAQSRTALNEEVQRLRETLLERNNSMQTLQAREVAAAAQVADLSARLAGAEAQLGARLDWIEESKTQLSHQFNVLAQTILDEKSRNFSTHSENAMQQLLSPLKDRLQHFQLQVEQTYDRESKERFSLQREVQRLAELNVKISDDAVNLTRALRGNNKAQGIWGERVLEQVLASSGLRAGEEYRVQASLLTDDGARQQPDIIVALPGGKHVVIDAKVSLIAFERCASAEDDQLRQHALKQHIDSIQQHVRDLSGKNYQSLYGLKSLDFVLMFMPVESAFTMAANHDAALFTRACERNVLLVSPSTLMVTLRTISNLWRQENQSRNALDIARHAGSLYDKFVGFVEALDDVGSKLNASQQAFEVARKRLTDGRGNLVRQVERLRDLGVKPAKTLDESWTAKALEADPDSGLVALPQDTREDTVEYSSRS